MKKNKLHIILALILAFAMLCTACGTADDSPKNSDTPGQTAPSTDDKTPDSGKELTTVNVAYEFPLTGGAGWVGELMRAGTWVALDDYKDELAEYGVEINAIFNDHQGSNDVAASNFTKNVDLYKTPVVVTSFTGPVMTQGPMAEASKVLAINCGAQADQCIGLSDYLYNIVPAYSTVSKAFADYLYNDLGYTKMAALGDNSSTAAAQHDNFVAAWKALGGEVVADVEVAADASDYMSACAQIIDAGAEFVVLCNTNDGLSARQMTQFLQLGATDMVFVNSGSGDRAFGKDFEQTTYVASQKVYSHPETIEQYESKYLVTDYPYANGALYVTNGYNATYIIVQLIEYCVDNGMEITGENLREAFNTLGTVNIQGGSVTLIEGNTVETPIEIYRGIAGEVELMKTYFEG